MNWSCKRYQNTVELVDYDSMDLSDDEFVETQIHAMECKECRDWMINRVKDNNFARKMSEKYDSMEAYSEAMKEKTQRVLDDPKYEWDIQRGMEAAPKLLSDGISAECRANRAALQRMRDKILSGNFDPMELYPYLGHIASCPVCKALVHVESMAHEAQLSDEEKEETNRAAEEFIEKCAQSKEFIRKMGLRLKGQDPDDQ